jgi:hypothetical protein
VEVVHQARVAEVAQLILHTLEPIADDGQWVVDLMGQPSRHDAHGSQSFGSAHLLLDTGLQRRVAKDQRRPKRTALLIPNRRLSQGHRDGAAVSRAPPGLEVDHGAAPRDLTPQVLPLGTIIPVGVEPESIGDLADGFLARIAEERHRPAIPHPDPALRVETDDRVRRMLEDFSQLRMGLP